MSLFARLIDPKLAQSVEEWGALPVLDEGLATLKAKYPNVPKFHWGEMSKGEEIGCWIGSTEALEIFAVCLAIKGKDDIPPQFGKRRALYNDFRRGEVQVKRWPHLLWGPATSVSYYLPIPFPEPVALNGSLTDWRIDRLCSAPQLLVELNELKPYLDCPVEYTEIREDNWDKLQSDVQRVEEIEGWNGEWSNWACLYWLAKLSTERKLLVIFH